MNKAQLADVVAAKMNLSKRQAEDTISLIFDTIVDMLQSGGEVTITGFGAFESRVRKGRTGVNPRNPAQRIQIDPVRVAKFRAGKTLKDALRVKPPGTVLSMMSEPVPEPPAMVPTL
ncbi:MAG: HU family DNA-binding protein [bacterium]|nr:HU family DNA-binding protein [bacterium]